MRGTEKPGVMLYWEVFDALEQLDPEDFQIMCVTIRNYAQYGWIPDFSDEPQLKFAWPMIKDKLDKDTRRYERKKQASRESGLASDFTRNYAPAHGINPNDVEAKREYIKRRLAEIENEEVNER